MRKQMTEQGRATVLKAAKIMKLLRLTVTPGMDTVSIKLNATPTFDELRVAETWFEAFERAREHPDTDAFTLAEEMHRG